MLSFSSSSFSFFSFAQSFLFPFLLSLSLLISCFFFLLLFPDPFVIYAPDQQRDKERNAYVWDILNLSFLVIFRSVTQCILGLKNNKSENKENTFCCINQFKIIFKLTNLSLEDFSSDRDSVFCKYAWIPDINLTGRRTSQESLGSYTHHYWEILATSTPQI